MAKTAWFWNAAPHTSECNIIFSCLWSSDLQKGYTLILYSVFLVTLHSRVLGLHVERCGGLVQKGPNLGYLSALAPTLIPSYKILNLLPNSRST